MTFGLILPCRTASSGPPRHSERPEHRPDPPQQQKGDEPRPHGRQLVRDLLLQAALLAILLVLYRLGRTIADGHVLEASRNATDLHDWERHVGLPDELTLQRWLLARPDLARAANAYYATVHFPLTAIALIWLYLRRPSTYKWTRTVIVSMTGIALILTFAVPLAPPRLMPDLGFTDVAATFGQSVYGGPTAGNANQYAAMPSLHVGWALPIAIALIRAGHTRWRWLWLLHPIATLLVVVGTANHYWLDGGAAVALFGLCCAVAAVLPDVSWQRLRGHRAHIDAQADAQRPAGPVLDLAGPVLDLDSGTTGGPDPSTRGLRESVTG